MTRSHSVVVLVAAIIAGIPRPAPVSAQSGLALAGRWTLNRSLSQIPREIGFATDGLPPDVSGAAPGGGGGGRGGRGSGSGGRGAVALPTRPESADDAQRLRLLLGEVRNPPARMTIAETDGAVAITNDKGQQRTFRPTGREEVLDIDGVSVGATTRREASRLTVSFNIEEGRTVRYAFEHADNPSQLIVEVALVGRGGGDKLRFVYEPAGAADTVAAPAPAPAATSASALGAGNAGSNTPFTQKPDAELKGITGLGIVVEDLSSEAMACGLTQSAIEAGVSKHLSDAGFKVLRNSDEDTYVYVHVITTNPSSSLCVSRYDVFFYTHVITKLSYQQTPVLVQVSLLNKGGLAGGSPATHATAVLRGVQDFVDQFAGRIHEANK